MKTENGRIRLSFIVREDDEKAIIRIFSIRVFRRKRTNYKEKKEIAGAVLKEVVDNHDFQQEVTAPENELFGFEEQVVSPGIMDLDQMAKFIEAHYSGRMFGS